MKNNRQSEDNDDDDPLASDLIADWSTTPPGRPRPTREKKLGQVKGFFDAAAMEGIR